MKIQKTNAMRWLDLKNISYNVLTYIYKDGESPSGMYAAKYHNEPFQQVFKTIVCKANTKEYLVYMIPALEELDFKKCAKIAGVKSVELLPLKDLTKITGYVRGGTSPIAMKKPFRTFIDESILNEDFIYFSGGKIGYQIHMKSEDLIQSLSMIVADLLKSKV